MRAPSLVAIASVAIISAIAPPQNAISVTPRMLASIGLPVRSDTLDGYVEDKGRRQFFGYYIHAVARTSIAGRAAYLVTMNYRNGSDAFQSDTLAIDSATFAPVWRRFHAKEDSVSVTFANRRATGYAVQNRNGTVTSMKIDHVLSDSALPAGVLRWVAGRLPLRAGYAAMLTTFNHWTGKEATSTFTVPRGEQLKMGARSYDAWVIDAGGATRWIDKATGLFVQERDPAALGGNDAWKVKR